MNYQNLDLSKILLTSRSAIECYQLCNYKRYLEYFYDGIGIVPKQKSIPLTTGTEVHLGIAHILEYAKKNKKVKMEEIEEGINVASDDYQKIVRESGLYGKGTSSDLQQKQTFLEQSALIEAIIRSWSLVELPSLLSRFNIIEVEKEIIFPMNIQVGELLDKRSLDAN